MFTTRQSTSNLAWTYGSSITIPTRKNSKSRTKCARQTKTRANVGNRAGDDEAPEDGFVPPSAESIGHEGPDAPVAERLKKYEAELAAMVKNRESQLEGVERAEFEKKEKDWRDEVETEAAKIKEAQKRFGLPHKIDMVPSRSMCVRPAAGL